MDGDPAPVVLATAPSAAQASDLAERLVDEGLAARATVIPGIISIFRRQGKREAAPEVLLIKTRADGYQAPQRRILEVHPYAVPVVPALAVDAGSPAHLQWVHDSVPVEGR